MTEAKAAPRRDRFPILLTAAVVVVLLAVGAAGLRSWRDLATQRAREAELEAAIAGTEADVRRLEERIERLHDDPLTLERLARHDLGMVRPDDVVFVFPEELSGKPVPRPRRVPQAAAPAPDVPAQRTPGAPDASAVEPARPGTGAPAATEATGPLPGPGGEAPAGAPAAPAQQQPGAAGATGSTTPAPPLPSAGATATPAARPDATPPPPAAAAPS